MRDSEGQWYFEPSAKGELDGMGWRSFWLTRPMLDQLLNECGLRTVETLKSEDDHCGRGARVALLLERVGDPPVVSENEGRKVFGIGLSKTGTTSLNEALRLLGLDARHWQADDAL
ncbi:MAG: sulfotransferase [Planctomycetaceae bacterium]